MLQEHRQHTYKTKGILTLLVDTFTALTVRRGFVAYIPITFVTIIMFCAAAWLVFLPQTDSARYECYALTFWLGGNATHLLPAQQCAFLISSTPQPFHMLPVEYPPLTLVPFSLALLVPLSYYQVAFALLMALAGVFIYWLLLRYGPRGAALIFALYLLDGAVATVQIRFDLLPAMLTLLAIIAVERKHWTAAYIALAIGVLLKLYPIILLPAFFIAEQQAARRLALPVQPLTFKATLQQLWLALCDIRKWRWKNSLIFFGVLVGVTGIFALFNFQEAIVSQLTYFLKRPIQVESTESTLLWLTTLFKAPLAVVYSYGSLNFINPFAGIVSLTCSALLVVGFAYTILIQWQGKLDVTQTSVALLFVFVATGKVFSPQYVIWLIPLLAYAGAFDTFWLITWGITLFLTSFIFSYLYTRPIDPLHVPFIPGFFELVGLRNIFFVLITLAYLFNWFNARQRKPLPPVEMGKETQPLYVE